VRIVWDEPKRQTNLDKHKLDFADVYDFEWETAVIEPSYNNRFKAVGYFCGGIVTIIYSYLGREAISVISFRTASRKERALL